VREFPHVHQPDDCRRHGKSPKEIVKTFGVPMITVKRYMKLVPGPGGQGVLRGPKPRHSFGVGAERRK